MANQETQPGRQSTIPLPPPTALRDKGLAGRREIEGQRRQVTVLFADVVGYTPLAQKLGDENTFLFMQRVIRELSEAVHTEEGLVQELTGDGLMALFGAPIAYEDAPIRACRAALDIQVRMMQIGDDVAEAHGARPQLRIDIHTGSVVVGKVGDDLQMEFTVLGDTANLASRLEGAAEPGEVLMSEATFALVGDYVESTLAGERELKGIEGRRTVHRLDGLLSEVSRFDVALKHGLTPLIGRHRELEQLEESWRQAKAGNIRLVNIVGEPGIGKSRLVHEFRAIAEGDDAIFFQGYCATGSRAALFRPFIEVVRRSFRVDERSDKAAATKALQGGLELLGLPADRHLPYLLNLLGYEAGDIIDRMGRDEVKRLTLETLQSILFERCRASPVVLCLEDLHWIDAASQGFLQWLAEAPDSLPLLVFCTYRPEHLPTWARGDHIAQIDLTPLTGTGTLDLVKRRLDVDELPSEFATLLNEKAEGNPLFAEEVTSYLIKSGQVRETERQVKFQAAKDQTGSAGVPDTLGGLLTQRIDRLENDTRRVLEAAAVVGTRFTLDLVGEVTGLGDALAHHLEELEREDLIFMEDSGNTSRFRIKHALVQDAVYNSLLSADRESLHLSVATAMERIYAGRENEVLDLLADHYTRTGKIQKAILYLSLAGERAYRTYSIPEADSRYHQALRLMEDNPGKTEPSLIIDLVLDLARLYYFTGQSGNLIKIVEKYLPDAEALGDKVRLSHCLSEIGYAYVFAGEPETGKPMLERALVMAQDIGDTSAQAHASAGLAWYYGFVAEYSPANRAALRENGERAFELGRDGKDFWLAAKGLYAMSIGVLIEGNPGGSRDLAQRLLVYSRTTEHPWPRAMGVDLLCGIDLVTEDFQSALVRNEESLHSINDPIAQQIFGMRKAAALTGLGRAREGCELFVKFRSELIQNRFILALSFMDYLYGVAQVLDGNFAQGIRFIKESRKQIMRWGNPRLAEFEDFFLGQIYLALALGEEKPSAGVIFKNLGFLIWNLPQAARKAEHHLRAAEYIFRQQNAPSFIAQALVGLGLLAVKRKRHDEAREIFQEARELAASVEGMAIVEVADKQLVSLRKN